MAGGGREVTKKTKDQLFTEWVGKVSKRHSFRRSLPNYKEIIKELSSNHDATDKLKHLVENYGPMDPYLEGLPLEEVELLGDASIGTNISVFEDAWIVKPIKWAWKSSCIRGGRDKVNWDVYLDDDGFVKFAVRQNTERQIKESIESWLMILKKNKIITFNPRGNPKVMIIGRLVSQENPGVILSLNPFADREKILNRVIQVLKKYQKKYRSFSFSRKDLLHPERRKALKLFGEGKSLREIAIKLWPKQFEKEKKKTNMKENVEGEERILYEQYVRELVRDGKSLGEAYKEADRKFHLKGKTLTNPLIVKAYRLIK